MIEVPEEIQEWDNLYWDNRSEYENRIKEINKIFELEDGKGFQIHPPTFFAGDVHSQEIRYVFIGLNPGYDDNSPKEIEWRRKRRKEEKLRDCLDLFEYFGTLKNFPRYYTRLIKLCPDYETSSTKKQREEFCNKYVVNIDAFPFHSKNNNKDIGSFTPDQLTRFFGFWTISKNLIRNIHNAWIIVVGRGNYKLLLFDPEVGYKKLKLIQTIKKQKKGYVHIYTFELCDRRGILIDTFLTGGNRLPKEVDHAINTSVKEILSSAG